MKQVALVSNVLVAAATLFGAIGCSSASTSSSSSGCDVAFSNVQAAGATLNTNAFHDDQATELFWNPKLKHVDVLGGNLKDAPSRVFEADLYGDIPIVDGAALTLRAFDPNDRALPVARVTLVNGNAPQLTSTGGTVHFTTASPTRLVFTVNDAKMEALDENQNVIAGAPSLTMAMTCNIPATEDP